MDFSPILAHGALGPFDEIIFASVAFIFVCMMGISWVKSRNSEPNFDDTVPDATPQASPQPDSEDRFQLD